MNYQEIIEKLKEYYKESEDYSSGFSWFAEEAPYQDVPEVGKCVTVDSGGGCDKGSDWYRVYHFTDHNVFIKVSGNYTSYSGTEFEDEWDGDVKEVFPEEKTITVYNSLKA